MIYEKSVTRYVVDCDFHGFINEFSEYSEAHKCNLMHADCPNATDCEECGTPLAKCDMKLVQKRKACCEACAEENTHNDTFEGSTERLSKLRRENGNLERR
jgi:hypothetical protein